MRQLDNTVANKKWDIIIIYIIVDNSRLGVKKKKNYWFIDENYNFSTKSEIKMKCVKYPEKKMTSTLFEK